MGRLAWSQLRFRPARTLALIIGVLVAAGGCVDPWIVAALLRLPARQRQVVALRLVLDLDTGRTAQVLGIAPGTVQAHLDATAAGAVAAPIPRSGSRARSSRCCRVILTSNCLVWGQGHFPGCGVEIEDFLGVPGYSAGFIHGNGRRVGR